MSNRIKLTSYTQKLTEFVYQHKVDRSQNGTHSSMHIPYGKFKIIGKDRKVFMDYYTKALMKGADLHFVEFHRAQGPIVIDLDLNFKQDDDCCDEYTTIRRYYTQQNIMDIIKIYNKTIIKYIDIDDDQLRSFVFEKEKPTPKNDKTVKDGFHIMYPFICTTPEAQYVIRQEVINKVTKSKILSNIPFTNKIEDVFDKSVIQSNGWIMYGSKKKDRLPYELTTIYDHEVEELDEHYNKCELPRLFSIRQYCESKRDSYVDGITEKYMHEKCKELNISKPKIPNAKKKTKVSDPDEVERAKSLVEILSPDRAKNYDDWLHLGFCLHNIDESLLDTWMEFSSLCPSKFDPEECQKVWYRCRDNGLGFGSLYRWAEIDNDGRGKFAEYKHKQLENSLEKALNGTDYNVSLVLYNIYRFQYACASIGKKIWYEFRGHRWVEIELGKTLYDKMNTSLVDEFIALNLKYGNLAMEVDDERKDLYLQKQEITSKISMKLRQSKFKDDLMKECLRMFSDANFLSNMNENRDLIGFENGVYDLEHCEFRDGRPEDRITFSTRINYVEYDPDNEHVKRAESIIKSILPDEQMRNYVLDLMASCIQGHLPDEKFHIWTGSGSNGKSVILELLNKSMGDYAEPISVTLLTRKKGSSSQATPELAKMKGKRFVMMQEPESDDKIHVGHMKELTGGDEIETRALFRDPIKFSPQFKIILACNKLPYIPANDGGTWRRIRVVPFEMKFVDKPSKPNERKIDKNLKRDIKMSIELREAFMSILIERFKVYNVNGLVEPDKVVAYTKEYQKSNDIYEEYIEDNILITSNNDDTILFPDLYADFTTWFRLNNPGKKVPARSYFKDEIEDKLGKIVDKKVHMVQFCNKQDDDSNASDRGLITDIDFH
jgi:P4 family phage/plasmid primase-like protien